MKTLILLLLAVAFIVGLASATVVMGNVISGLGLGFLAMLAIFGLVVAAAREGATSEEDAF